MTHVFPLFKEILKIHFERFPRLVTVPHWVVTECTQTVYKTQRNPGFCVQEEWDLLTLLSEVAEYDESDDDVKDKDQFDDIGLD